MKLIGLRMWPIPGFKRYLNFYRPRRNGIEVVRVLHGAMDLPGELRIEAP
jgi:toxin ParE1/3/4